MPKEQVENLKEFKADGEDSSTYDPVAPAGGDPKKKNRKADVSKKVDPNADDIEDDVKTPENKSGGTKKAPLRKADKANVKESIDEMFDGQDLSEDFKTKASVVFESALNVAINEELEKLEEEFETRLEEQTETAINELIEKVDSYLSYVVEKWMEENEVAIERGIRTEIAESFMTGLYDLMLEHNVDLPEEKVDVVADLVEKLEEAEAKRDESVSELLEVKKQLVEAQRQDALDEITEGLTQTQVEKLEKLVEGVDAETIDQYKEKIAIIKENYFERGKKTLTEDADVADPMDAEDENVKAIDPEMKRFADAISKSLRK